MCFLHLEWMYQKGKKPWDGSCLNEDLSAFALRAEGGQWVGVIGGLEAAGSQRMP